MLNDVQWCSMYASHSKLLCCFGSSPLALWLSDCPLRIARPHLRCLEDLWSHIPGKWRRAFCRWQGKPCSSRGVVTRMSHPGWLPHPPLEETISYERLCVTILGWYTLDVHSWVTLLGRILPMSYHMTHRTVRWLHWLGVYSLSRHLALKADVWCHAEN